jgi:hypothetical protein
LGQDNPKDLHKPRYRAEDEAHDVDPVLMEPTVECEANEPSDDYGGR